MAANRITTLSTELTRLSVQATRLELPWWQPPGHRALPTGQQVNCNGNAIRREVWLRTAEGRKVSSSYLTPKIAACQLVASRQTRTDRRGRNWRLNSARRPFRERKTINILKLPPAARLSATSFDLTCLINSSANKTSERGGDGGASIPTPKVYEYDTSSQSFIKGMARVKTSCQPCNNSSHTTVP